MRRNWAVGGFSFSLKYTCVTSRSEARAKRRGSNATRLEVNPAVTSGAHERAEGEEV